jgi:ABC-2 type transport system ATP-binding protein
MAEAEQTAEVVEVDESTNGAEPSRDDLNIEVDNITKAFGPTVAVDQVSFNVRKGEVVGFLGPNGSGKTTTMRLLTSFYTPDSGRILIEGIDNQEHDVATREKIGYLPENNPVYGDMLVHEALSFVAELRGLTGARKKQNIEQAVQETGIQEIYYRPLNQCSKGFKQRAGLAQAILHRPDILIMDEPTEGLDPNQRVPIRELIRSMGDTRTVLLSTHVLQEVEETCDRLLIISKGRIVAQGTVDELQTQSRGRGRFVNVEIEGDRVESDLAKLPRVTDVRREERVDGRKRYVLEVAGGADIRPDIFQLAKRRGWVLWELHEEAASLQDMFHLLTTEEGEKE